jgi:hypothetical protein
MTGGESEQLSHQTLTSRRGFPFMLPDRLAEFFQEIVTPNTTILLPPKNSSRRVDLRDEVRQLPRASLQAGSGVRLLSRNRTLFNDNYPRLVDSRKALKAKGFIVDGRLGTSEPIPKSTQPDCSFRLLRVISQKCHVLTR